MKKNTTTKFFKGIVSSSFNIQYQSPGISTLSSLDEIELVRMYVVYFHGSMALSDDRLYNFVVVVIFKFLTIDR